jgi:ABC-type multidrug transport system fused ATPase/permease subunit
MISDLLELYSFLQSAHKRKLIYIQAFIFFMAIAELVTVFSIVPFMAIVADPTLIETNEIFIFVFNFINAPFFEDNIIFYLGIFVVIAIFFSTLISIITVWYINIQAQRIGYELASSLYLNYMNESWAFHTLNHSSKLTNKIMNEASRLTSHIINPILQINARLVVVVFIAGGLIIASPSVAILSVIIFAVAYLIIFNLIKSKLAKNSKTLTFEQEKRVKLINDGFGGIKDTLILGRQNFFVSQFFDASNKVARAGAINQALSQIPRYALEFLAFTGLVSIVLTFYVINDGNISSILPIVSLFAIGAFKLLPAFQILFSSVSMIQGNISAIHSIKNDLNSASCIKEKHLQNSFKKLTFKDSITFKNISFTYPGKNSPALTDINITIPKNHKIALVGPSGSGKSTMIDILLGLIRPSEGMIEVDGVSMNKSTIRDFQNNIGFVPQSTFLSDTTILENIAFGLPIEKINNNSIQECIKLARLDEFIDSLPDGLDTMIGERGVQISGGQKQRISIARALYNDAELLVFDEATSSLDGNTESKVMNEINNLSHTKTIVLVAHRLSTVKTCDCIYFFDNGRIIDCGTFSELLEKNISFREMAAKS